MEAELSPLERCKILQARIKALKSTQSIDLETRLVELRRAEKALKQAEIDLANADRARDKFTRASKPLKSEAETAAAAWDIAMEQAGKRRTDEGKAK